MSRPIPIFSKTFGRPERNITCECERTADPSMTQMLDISNGDTINKKLESKECCLTQFLATNAPANTNHRTRLFARLLQISFKTRGKADCCK